MSTNEGSAVAFAIGHYLSNKNPALVYLQNSGLGNAINPNLFSSQKVYGIPMLLLIGWRGEIFKKKQIKDEPQHNVQGRITLQQLKLLQIPFKILSPNEKNFDKLTTDLKNLSLKIKGPVALVIRKNTFLNKSFIRNKFKNKHFLNRKEILNIILQNIPKNSVILCTTGLRQRIISLRIEKRLLSKDFLTVGGMGHVSQIIWSCFQNKKKILYV